MRLSDIVAARIMEMLNDSGGSTEIQRNSLANMLGCVPSQINYVIASRFTPEQGYVVQSQRGGGGYIRITRVSRDRPSAVMHVVNSIGDSLDGNSARIIVVNLCHDGLISAHTAALIHAAMSENCYRDIEPRKRGLTRAAIFKAMLLTE